jgi:hypothetical protein
MLATRIICSEPILIALLAVCFFSEFGKGQSQSLQHRSKAENEALVSLSSTLESLDCQAVIEYSGKCYRPGTIIASPVLLNASPIRREDAAGTIQQLLSKDTRFTITSDPDRIFTIAQDIPQDLLNLRIREIEFTKQQQYEPRDASDAVLNAPEVQAYFKAHHISVANSWGGFVARPNSNLPHLDPRIENTTVLGAVKIILKAFPTYIHLAIYRECSTSGGRRMVAIGFK